MRILIATPLLLWAVMRSDTNKVWVHTTNPRASSLYQPFDSHYETVKAMREQRFERQYGFWRRRSNGAVAASLDCGCSNPDVHNHTTVYPSDTEGLDRLACHVPLQGHSPSSPKKRPSSGPEASTPARSTKPPR